MGNRNPVQKLVSGVGDSGREDCVSSHVEIQANNENVQKAVEYITIVTIKLCVVG